jgi:hypothetical protein
MCIRGTDIRWGAGVKDVKNATTWSKNWQNKTYPHYYQLYLSSITVLIRVGVSVGMLAEKKPERKSKTAVILKKYL